MYQPIDQVKTGIKLKKMLRAAEQLVPAGLLLSLNKQKGYSKIRASGGVLGSPF